MEKLNTIEINAVLKDVRASYRLLALYQKRLLDIIKYITNAYGATFNSGWSKFSNQASHGSKVSLNKWSWDWLSMYLYEFNLGTIEQGEDKYHLKIIHQSDTGFYDAKQDKKITKQNIEQFGSVDTASTRLFFMISKNEDGYPLQKILNGNLTAKHTSKIVNGNWLAVPYDIERFTNQDSTDLVLKDFDAECRSTFGMGLMLQE